jgi:hypothetical protein
MSDLIAHITVPINPKDLTQIREIMVTHGASVTKANTDPDDHWYLLLLPENTRYDESRCKVTFPDGYWFLYQVGVVNRRTGISLTPPMIVIRETERTNVAL